MWWQYALVLVGAILVDITPLPLPPAFSLMIVLQVVFRLDVWPVILLGVAGSAIGRAILAWYIPAIANRLLSRQRNRDIRLIGEMLKSNRLRGQLIIILYTLMPLSSTPLFIAGGIAGLRPMFILPGFMLGKFASDSIAVWMGAYAVTNTENVFEGSFSFHSVLAILMFVLLMFILLFLDWRKLFFHKKLRFRFDVWKTGHEEIGSSEEMLSE